MLYYRNTRLIVEISYPVISEGLSFNLAQKPRFKEVLDFAENISKGYISTNSKLIIKGLIGVIHDYNIKSRLVMIKKEAYVSELLFLVYGTTISRTPLLEILVSSKKLQQQFYKLLIVKAI